MGAGTLGLQEFSQPFWEGWGRCGCFQWHPALEALPSRTDHRLIADEDDVHRCGRCQAEFTALEDFVQHKLQKVCQRAPQEALPAAPAAGALLGQEVSSPLPRPAHTRVCVRSPPRPRGPLTAGRGVGAAGALWLRVWAEGWRLVMDEGGSGPSPQELSSAPGWPSLLSSLRPEPAQLRSRLSWNLRACPGSGLVSFPVHPVPQDPTNKG